MRIALFILALSQLWLLACSFKALSGLRKRTSVIRRHGLLVSSRGLTAGKAGSALKLCASDGLSPLSPALGSPTSVAAFDLATNNPLTDESGRSGVRYRGLYLHASDDNLPIVHLIWKR